MDAVGIHPYWSVHQEVADNHSREGGLPPLLFNMNGGGLDAGENPDVALVGSRRGK